MRRLLLVFAGMLVMGIPLQLHAQLVLDEATVASHWERVAFTGDSLGYGVFVNRIDSTRVDRAVLYYDQDGVPTAWRATVAGQEYFKVPGFGVFAITDSVRIAQAVIKREPNIMEALYVLDAIEQRVQASPAQ